jgi:hypothetical protein
MEDLESTAFNFELEYPDKPVDCKVVMNDASYDVYFDGRYMGDIQHTEDFTWIQASGVILPQGIVDEIGFQIEHMFK